MQFHLDNKNTPLINVRSYRKSNQKWTIQRNRQHRGHKTKKQLTKTQHNMCWIPLYASKHKQRKYDTSPSTNNWR